MNELGRRAFLRVAGLLSPIAILRNFVPPRPLDATPPAPSGLPAFLALSARLTGRTRLDPVLAQTYLSALLSMPGKGALLADLSGRGVPPGPLTPAHGALEQEILVAWYTGTHEVDGRRHLATHGGALMWSALGRPAPGACASMGASWSQPPKAAR